MKTSLYPHLGDNDIMVGSLHEALQKNVRMNAATRRALCSVNGLRNFAKTVLMGHGVAVGVNQAVKSYYTKSLSQNPPHATASELKANVGEQIWKQYYKFCFVRNPFDQVISDYHWRNKSTSSGYVSFDDFLSDIEIENSNSKKVKNWEIYTINSEVAVDFIGKFENLYEDFKLVTRTLGLGDVEIAHKKKGMYDRNKIQSLNTLQVARIERIFSNEIATFNYHFA